ncbi:MAG: ABC transporter permease [Pyrinomonadaceae bacterium]
MKKALLIAQREFLMTVGRKAYLVLLFGLPLLMLSVGVVSKYVLSNLDRISDTVQIGVVDRADVIDFKLAGTDEVIEASLPLVSSSKRRRISIERYASLDDGLNDLRGARLDLLCMIEPDFIERGEVKLYTRNLWVASEPSGIERFRALLRASLLARLGPERQSGNAAAELTLRRVLTPARLDKRAFADDGELVSVGTTRQVLGRLAVPYCLMLLLTISVFVSANYLLEATAEEKENRAVEIMLSSVKPTQLLWGKIIGLGGAALLQAFTYVAIIGVLMLVYGEDPAMTATDLVLSLVYCAVGFLLYAGLLAAIGIMGGNMHNNSQLATPLMMIVAIPLLLEFIILDAPNGTLARVLSYIPFTAPLTMVYRLSLTKVSVFEIVSTLCLLAASAYLTVRGAAKIFRAAALMYGKRITIPEVVRWLRES